MKSKPFIYLSIIAGNLLGLTACKKSFLNVNPQGQTLESNYYQSPDQALAGLVAAYNPLAWTTVSSYCGKELLFTIASDEANAGGGSSSDQAGIQALNNYPALNSATPGVPPDLWQRNFDGVYRCNVMLEKIGNVPGLTDALKTRYTAEVKFLRAYYYFDLLREFGNIPLILTVLQSNEWYNQLQAKPADVYARIEKDLNDAIPGLPATVPAATEGGRASKYAALALLGKVILYQNNTSRMQEAAADFEQVNTSSNYQLLPNFGDIFNPGNKFNAESIFEVVHTSAGGRDWGAFSYCDGNTSVQLVGPRNYNGPVYESNTAGYGFAPVSKDLAAAMKSDPRYPYTMVNMDSLKKAGYCSYDSSYQNTGFYVRKFAPLTQYQATVGVIPLNWTNDEIEIRLADTYLMEAEAMVRGGGDMGKAQMYLDKVRARVGLPSVPATLDNIYNERRFELATEGHRWFDLIRTGKAAATLAYKGFQTGKNELLPIPLAELNNTKLVQNPGYPK